MWAIPPTCHTRMCRMMWPHRTCELGAHVCIFKSRLTLSWATSPKNELICVFRVLMIDLMISNHLTRKRIVFRWLCKSLLPPQTTAGQVVDREDTCGTRKNKQRHRPRSVNAPRVTCGSIPICYTTHRHTKRDDISLKYITMDCNHDLQVRIINARHSILRPLWGTDRTRASCSQHFSE
jgi:hypothetical protein